MNKQILRYIIFVGLFAVPFIPFLVSAELFFPFIVTKAFAWRIIVEIVFGVWVVLTLVDKNYRPRKSLILYSLIAFLVIIGLADLLGATPLKSFWSNFERMEGYVTLLHLGAFFLVISSVFRGSDPASAEGYGETMWKRWWNTSLSASFLMIIFCILQIVGLKTINQGGVRVDGTFGNAIYLAVYILFHMFIAGLFLWREWGNKALRWVYGILIILQGIILYYTATRGAILGLLGGLLIVALLNIRNHESNVAKKGSLAILTALVLVVGGFFALRNTSLVQESPVLSRFSSITTEEIKRGGRSFVWPIAWEGIKEKPLLGWGQGNFMLVFQEGYVPEMHRLEPWFDRAHNIFLDWGIAGGFLGLFAYLSLYVSLLYLLWKRSGMSYTEKSIITGLVSAYFFHNIFVFDHLTSYILFFALLAYIHSRTEGEALWNRLLSEDKVKFMVLPAVIVITLGSIYHINLKPLEANYFVIKALKSMQIPGAMRDAPTNFRKAYEINTELGKTEVVEQMASNSATILRSDISLEEKEAFFRLAKGATLERAESYPQFTRQQISTGSFLSTTGQLEEALVYLNRARELMPFKQEIYLEIANAEIHLGRRQEAVETLRHIIEFSPDHKSVMEEYIRQIQAGEI